MTAAISKPIRIRPRRTVGATVKDFAQSSIANSEPHREADVGEKGLEFPLNAKACREIIKGKSCCGIRNIRIIFMSGRWGLCRIVNKGVKPP